MVRSKGSASMRAKRGTRFEALEPIRQGVRQQFGAVSAGIATALQVRATIAERSDRQVRSNMTTTVSKKSGAVQA
ncbi:hypothetical protein [Nitrospira sp. BLG_2]|uniref:hypothetical protein n=1 Tax=Nitrospira sp. BLG_2 TaxID=3397507 RepID=UPI003B9C1905